jgi:hypothetical protein
MPVSATRTNHVGAGGLDLGPDLPTVGELDRVREQVEEDLADLGRVAVGGHPLRHARDEP